MYKRRSCRVGFVLVCLVVAVSMVSGEPVATVRIQAPEVMAGPDNRADFQYFGLRIGDELLSYTANSYTYNRRGSTLEASREETNFYSDVKAALLPGVAGSIDERGAWLLHAEVDNKEQLSVNSKRLRLPRPCRPRNDNRRLEISQAKSTKVD